MPLTVTVNTIAECLRTDCNILGDNKKYILNSFADKHLDIVMSHDALSMLYLNNSFYQT
jgi:hypothetical protein